MDIYFYYYSTIQVVSQSVAIVALKCAYLNILLLLVEWMNRVVVGRKSYQKGEDQLTAAAATSILKKNRTT